MHEAQETQFWSLDLEDPVEWEMAAHSSILAWKTPWTEEPGGLSPQGHKESDMTEHTRMQIEVNPCHMCVLNCSIVSGSLRLHGLASLSMGILQARILEWVAMPSFRGSSQPRDRTRVSCVAGRFFTIWATRDLPNPGIKLWSPTLLADSYV